MALIRVAVISEKPLSEKAQRLLRAHDLEMGADAERLDRSPNMSTHQEGRSAAPQTLVA